MRPLQNLPKFKHSHHISAFCLKTVRFCAMIAGVALAGLAAVGGMLLLVFAGLTSAWALLTFGIGSAAGGFMRLRGALVRFAAMQKTAWRWLVSFTGVLKTAALGLWRLAVTAGKAAWLALQKFIAALARLAVAAGQTALAALRSLIAGLASFAVTLGKGLIAGVMALGNAIAWLARGFLLLSRAILTNPIVLAIAAIAAVAWLLYENWDKVTAYLRERWEALVNWWHNTPIGQKIIDVFTAPLQFMASLADIFWGIMVAVGKRIITAIFGWDVYNTLVSIFSEGIEWVMKKMDALIGKIKTAWEKMKELLGLSDGSILANEPPKTFAEKQAWHTYYNENKAAIDAAREAPLKQGLSEEQIESIKRQTAPAKSYLDVIKDLRQTAPVKPVAKKENTIINHNVNVEVKADGVGLQEVAGMITKQVTQGIQAANREFAARSRAALYDAHA